MQLRTEHIITTHVAAGRRWVSLRHASNKQDSNGGNDQ
jgi:hypothetical protein